MSYFIKKNNFKNIDILKIDAEGYEYNILKGINNLDFRKIRFIYFEHHYDLMIKKGYKFSQINEFLNKKKFFKKYKLRMKFRKSFEYIYELSKKKILASIIVVNYNNAKYLTKCLGSIFNQSYKFKEIIAVDNNSNDNSLEILKKFKKIKIVLNKKRTKEGSYNQIDPL